MSNDPRTVTVEASLQRIGKNVIWNPRFDNILETFKPYSTNNHLLQLNIKGTGKFTMEEVHQPYTKYLKDIVRKVKYPLRMASKTIKPYKEDKGHLNFDQLYKDAQSLKKAFPEVYPSLTVETLIWEDIGPYQGKYCWMGRLVRNPGILHIKLVGEDRQKIPDLADSGLYLPLALDAIARRDMHRSFRVWSRPKWNITDLELEDYSPYFPNRWFKSEFFGFFKDRESEIIVRNKPIRATYDGVTVHWPANSN